MSCSSVVEVEYLKMKSKAYTDSHIFLKNSKKDERNEDSQKADDEDFSFTAHQCTCVCMKFVSFSDIILFFFNVVSRLPTHFEYMFKIRLKNCFQYFSKEI